MLTTLYTNYGYYATIKLKSLGGIILFLTGIIIKNGGIIMDKNMLTTKETTLLSDLLTYEETACKKARLYSKITTNQKLAEDLTRIADNHQRRFNELLELL